MNSTAFDDRFTRLTGDQKTGGQKPLPWQRRLFGLFRDSQIPAGVDIPTGLGKTRVIDLWLLALAEGAPLPRRLVYVVDRRAVVDQATTEALRLAEALKTVPELMKALGLRDGLPVQTLRGQHRLGRSWRSEPDGPAIFVGTVDMVGSRLLFSGYGTSSGARPVEAGLLGCDALFVLDEAHLVPPFAHLLQAIAGNEANAAPRGDLTALIPGIHVVPLSATSRAPSVAVFRLDAADRDHPIVAQRLGAHKALRFVEPVVEKGLPEALTAQVQDLLAQAPQARILLFCDRREDAEKAHALLEQQLKGKAATPILFVGARRLYERQQAEQELRDAGFLAGAGRPSHAQILVATAAAEVGVDLDADHLVCDLVAWERMVQRLGRVNRRGERTDTQVIVIPPEAPEPAKAETQSDKDLKYARQMACETLLGRLPALDEGLNASPGALADLRNDASNAQLIEQATTPEPLRPPLTRAAIEAWSMTSLKEHSGRPDIEPFLRGWIDDDPQTRVIWRTHLPVDESGATLGKDDVTRYFDALPVDGSEVLETETFRVVKWLETLGKVKSSATTDNDAKRDQAVVAFVYRAEKKIAWTQQLLKDLLDKKKLADQLSGATLILQSVEGAKDGALGKSGFAGLKNGLLDAKFTDAPPTADADAEWSSQIGRRARIIRDNAENGNSDEKWRDIARFTLASDDVGPTRELIIEAIAVESNMDEDGRSQARRAQGLAEHQGWAAEHMRRIAERLRLDAVLGKALVLAARLHDEGKQAKLWQQAFHIPKDVPPLAKSGSRRAPDVKLLDGYRHEFGSLRYAMDDAEFVALKEANSKMADLVLHLIASHHGHARPTIKPLDEDAPPSVLEGRARDVALRFARLQRQWGPWGLAWMEALLRAADVRASIDNDRGRLRDG